MQTRTSLSQCTHDRNLWLNLLSQMHHVLPRPLSELDSATLSSLQLEHLLKAAMHVERIWLLPRKDSFLVEDTSTCIRQLAFITDHYLLSLAAGGQFNLWKIGDVFAPFAIEVVTTYDSATWHPCAYHLDAAASVLAIALTHVGGSVSDAHLIICL